MHSRAFWVSTLLCVGLFCWPVKTTVSAPLRLKVIMQDGTPFSGLSVTQQWGVYGYGGSRGEETKITDGAGMVELPTRHSTVTLGMRTLRRAGAFFTQCTTIPIYGSFLSGFTDKWGPIAHITIQLPPGIWIPALPYHGFTSPYANDDDYNYSGGPHHYIQLHNKDHKQPIAYIGGTAEIKSSDSTITLRLRPKPDEPEDRNELHNLLFKQASDLLQPYLILAGTKPKSTEDQQSRNELETAISLYERVMGLNPSNWAAAWLAGKAAQSLGDHERAYRFFKASYRKQKTNPNVARELMLACLETKRAKEAVEIAEHAAQLDAADAGLKANLALAQLCAGNAAQAAVTIDASLKQDPHDEITVTLKRVINEVLTGKRPFPQTPADLER